MSGLKKKKRQRTSFNKSYATFGSYEVSLGSSKNYNESRDVTIY